MSSLYEEGPCVIKGRLSCSGPVRAGAAVVGVERRASLYRLLGEDRAVGGLAPVAHLVRGRQAARRSCGACRSEGLVAGERVPDRVGEAAGEVDLGDLGASLSAEPGVRSVVAVAVERVFTGVRGSFDQRPTWRRYSGLFWRAGRGGRGRLIGRRAGRGRCSRRACAGCGSHEAVGRPSVRRRERGAAVPSSRRSPCVARGLIVIRVLWRLQSRACAPAGTRNGRPEGTRRCIVR